MEAEDGTGACLGSTLAPDHEHSTTDSCRAELSGLLAGLLALLTVCIFHNVQEGRVEIGCDGDSTVNVSCYDRDTHPMNGPNVDLRKAIARVKLRLKQEHGITLEWIYVDGHRDFLVSWDHLTRPEQLNCICDSKAK